MSPVRNAGGCSVDLEGGEFVISKPLRIPEMIANFQLGYGSLIVHPTKFPSNGPTDNTTTNDAQGTFLLYIGKKDCCHSPQGSCNIDLHFPQLFLDGSSKALGYDANQ